MEILDLDIYEVKGKSQDSDSKYISLHLDKPGQEEPLLHIFSQKKLSIKELHDETIQVKGISFRDIHPGDLLVPYDKSIQYSRKAFALVLKGESKRVTQSGALMGWNGIRHSFFERNTISPALSNVKIDQKKLYQLSFSHKIPLSPGMTVKSSEGIEFYILALESQVDKNLGRFTKIISGHRGINLFSLYFALVKINRVTPFPDTIINPQYPNIKAYCGYLWEEDFLAGKQSRLIKYCRWLGGRTIPEVREYLKLDVGAFQNILDQLLERELITIKSKRIQTIVQDERNLLSPLGKGLLTKIEEAGEDGVPLMEDRNPAHEELYQMLSQSSLVTLLDKEYYFATAILENIIAKIKDRVGSEVLGLEEIKEVTGWGRKKAFALIKYLYEEGLIDTLEEGRRFV